MGAGTWLPGQWLARWPQCFGENTATTPASAWRCSGCVRLDRHRIHGASVGAPRPVRHRQAQKGARRQHAPGTSSRPCGDVIGHANRGASLAGCGRRPGINPAVLHTARRCCPSHGRHLVTWLQQLRDQPLELPPPTSSHCARPTPTRSPSSTSLRSATF